MPDLDSFLAVPSESPEVAPEPAPAPEPSPVPAAVEKPAVEASEGVTGEPPAPSLPPRDEKGRWQKSDPAPHTVPLEALLSERERRQRAERELEERSKATQTKPDFWDNPDAAVEHAVKAREAEIVSMAEARARETFFKFTENAARSRHADYDQMRQVFAEEAERNPMLASQLRDAPDPAEFIYRQGQTAAQLREVGGDLSAYRKRVEAEIRQKLERELAERQALTASIPQSLNTEPSKGAGISGGSWAGPTPLEDILPTRRG